MIGSGIPINHSKAPLPKPMIASLFFRDQQLDKGEAVPRRRAVKAIFSSVKQGLCCRIVVLEDATRLRQSHLRSCGVTPAWP